MRDLIRSTVLIAVGLFSTATVSGQSWTSEAPPFGQPVARQHGVLLLRNGQVLAGEIAKIEDRYSIVVDRGEVRLHQRDVQCVCRDLEEAYRQKRLQGRDDCVEDHLDLAQWCQSYGLLDYAREELRIAADLNPTHPLIPLVDRKIRMSAQQQEPLQPSTAASDRHEPSVEELDRMVRGMPSGAVEMFTQSIQPLLVNNCTVSGCHSAGADNGFHLLRTPSGRPPSRRLTQRNLLAAVKLIRWEDPANSPLLTAPIKPHGASRTAMFTDRQVDQYQELVRWVNLVALGKKVQREKASDVVEATYEDGKQSKSAVFPASHEIPTTGAPEPPLGVAPPGLHGRQPASEPQAGDKASRVQRGANLLQFAPTDPFDPEIFNRRFAPPVAAGQNEDQEASHATPP